MSFRNFDNRDRYCDLSGNPLKGCVQFMIKDGTTVANIFDGDGVPLSNPQLTDILGRTDNQVFVDSDVVAYMYKYIGTGTLAEEEEVGIDTSDESKWALQYTVENEDINTLYIDGNSSMGVSNLDSLRALDVSEVPAVDGVKIIELEGYYEAGDCEAVNYVWDSESRLNDNNGSVIAPDGMQTGRWILVKPTEHLDSRHFGVFPQDSADADVDHSTRITQLLAYCNANSIRPFFNGSTAYPYFIYDSAAYNSRNVIDVSYNTQFVDKGSGNRFYGEWGGNPYFVNANTTVNSRTVRHSWHFKDYSTDTIRYIVDDRWAPVNLSGIQVELEVSPASGSSFDNCSLTSNHVITDRVVMENMEIRQDWFAEDYDWANLQIANCTILLDNFDDADTYILLKNKQNEADYGDLGEQTVSGATLLANCIAENASFVDVILRGDAELHNVSGTVSMYTTGNTVNAIDCWLEFTGDTVLQALSQRRGSLNGTVRILQTAYLDNVEVCGSLETSGATSVHFIGCTISGTQYLGKAAYVTGCTISGDIVLYPEPHTVTISGMEFSGQMYCGGFFNNVFIGDESAVKPSPRSGVDYSSTLVGILCKFIGNTSDHDFVDDTAWEDVAFASRLYSQMVYQDNRGGCPEEFAETTVEFPYVADTLANDDASNPYDGNNGLWVLIDHKGPTTQSNYPTSVYWVANFTDFAIDVSKCFRLKVLGPARPYVNLVNAEIRSYIRTDDDGLFCHSMDVGYPVVGAALASTADTTAELSCVQPLVFTYTESRYYGNLPITSSNRSNLYQVLQQTISDPARYNAHLHVKYKLT